MARQLEHGTHEKYDAGECTTSAECPALWTHGLTCETAHYRHVSGERRYAEARARRATPEQTARRLGITSSSAVARLPRDQHAAAIAIRSGETPADPPPAEPTPAPPAKETPTMSPKPTPPVPTPPAKKPAAAPTVDHTPIKPEPVEEHPPTPATPVAKPKRKPPAPYAFTALTPDERREVRTWARAQGYEVGGRGGIATIIIEKWRAARTAGDELVTKIAEHSAPADKPDVVETVPEDVQALADAEAASHDEPVEERPENPYTDMLDEASDRAGLTTAIWDTQPAPPVDYRPLADRADDLLRAVMHELGIRYDQDPIIEARQIAAYVTRTATVDAGGRPDSELIRELEQKLAAAEQDRDAAVTDARNAQAGMVLALRKWADGQDTIDRLERVIASYRTTLHSARVADWTLATYRRIDAAEERRRIRRPLIAIVRPLPPEDTTR